MNGYEIPCKYSDFINMNTSHKLYYLQDICNLNNTLLLNAMLKYLPDEIINKILIEFAMDEGFLKN